MPLPTPEEVVQAYKDTDSKPEISVFFDQNNGRCCALGVIALVRLEKSDPISFTSIARLLKVSQATVRAYAAGFDGSLHKDFIDRTYADPQQKYHDDWLYGRKAYIAVRRQIGKVYKPSEF